MILFIILRNLEENKCPITGNQSNRLKNQNKLIFKNQVANVYLTTSRNVSNVTLNLKSSSQRSMCILILIPSPVYSLTLAAVMGK